MSCGDYEYFKFSPESGLKVADIGVPKRSGLEGVDALPLRYRLERSDYQVDIKVDETTYGPSALISATSGSEPVAVKMVTTTKLPNSEQYCFSYREIGKQLSVSWLGGHGCEAINAFQIAVQRPDGTTQGLEVLPFDVVKNGRYCVEDGP